MVFNFYFYLKGNYRVRRGDREKESEKGLQWQGLCHAKGRSQEASRSPVWCTAAKSLSQPPLLPCCPGPSRWAHVLNTHKLCLLMSESKCFFASFLSSRDASPSPAASVTQANSPSRPSGDLLQPVSLAWGAFQRMDSVTLWIPSIRFLWHWSTAHSARTSTINTFKFASVLFLYGCSLFYILMTQIKHFLL